MDNKTVTISTRIEPRLKAEATKLFEQFDLTLNAAIELFPRQSLASKSIPFEVEIPNETTKRALSRPMSEGVETTWEDLERVLDES